MYSNYYTPYTSYSPNYMNYNIPSYSRMAPSMARMPNIASNMTSGLASNNFGSKITGLFGGIKKINWKGMLSGTQKTLNMVNQAIPIYNQVKPMYNNVRTMMRVFNAVKDDPREIHSPNTTQANNNIKKEETNGPSFFL